MRSAIYARVSRPDEADILTNQLEAARTYAKNHGFEIQGAHIFSEIASGGDEGRVALNDVLKAAEQRKVDIVVFTSLSRMTRGGVGAALYVLKRLENAGCGWHFVEQPILNFDSNTPKLAKDIVLAVLAAVDEDYRRTISSKTRAAFQKRKNLAAARGEPLKWGRPRKEMCTPKAIVERGPSRKSGRFTGPSVKPKVAP